MVCPKCEHQETDENVKLCSLCGAELFKSSPYKIVSSAGNLLVFIGYANIVLNSIVFAYNFFDPSIIESWGITIDAPGLVLSFALAFVYIVLGKRLKIKNNIDSKNYLWLTTILFILHLTWIIKTGGRVGVLLFVAFACFIAGIIKLNSALKNTAYKESLIKPDYKIKKKQWIILGVLAILVFLASFALVPLDSDTNVLDSISQQDGKMDVNQVVSEIKTQMALPERIDEFTELTGVVAQPNAIRYVYTLINTDIDQIDQDMLRSSIQSSLCADSSTLKLLNMDAGIDFIEYMYAAPNSNKTLLLKFNKQDCN